MMLVAKASALGLLSLVVAWRVQEQDDAQPVQKRRSGRRHVINKGNPGNCALLRASLRDNVAEDQIGTCDVINDHDLGNVKIGDFGNVCEQEVKEAVTEFCQGLQRWDSIYRFVYGKKLRCTGDDWTTKALETIPAAKHVDGIIVSTNNEDWDSISDNLKQLSPPIVQYLDVGTMKFNIDIDPDGNYHDCITSDLEKIWGISPEMQDQEKSKSCKAWQLQQQDMQKDVNAIPSKAEAAHNFCRLFSQSAFDSKNENGRHGLDVRCVWHPNNAFRVHACIGDVCKESMEYVHEVLGADGFFNMSLSKEGEAFMGPQWHMWGNVAVDLGGNTTLKSDGVTLKTSLSKTPLKFSLEAGDAGSIANIKFNPAKYKEMREAVNQKLQNPDPEENDRLWDKRCPKINLEMQRHPCAYEIAIWIADFCATFHEQFEMEDSLTQSSLALTCQVYGGSTMKWSSMQLLTLPRTEVAGQGSARADGAIYQYVDLNSQTLNMPVEFKSVGREFASFDSCMNVSLPERKAVHWRKDGKKLVFSA